MNVLPKILATITQHPRQKVIAGVNFNWSKKSFVHNVFRAYELLFGRRYGIRIESAATSDGVVQFFTWESVFAHIETQIRSMRVPKIKKIYIPQLAPVQGLPIASPYLFAVTFESTSQIGSTSGATTSKTWTHTCTGSGLTLVAGFAKNGLAQAITNQTYNSVAMTEGNQTQATTSGNSICYLAGPATGANTVSGQVANASEWANISVSMTGTTATPSSPGANGASSTSTSPSVAVTTTANNSWVVDHMWNINATPSTTVTGTNQTNRNTVQDTDSGFSASMSTQTTTTAGSYTSGWTITVGLWVQTGVEVQSDGLTTVVLPFKSLMGVGI